MVFEQIESLKRRYTDKYVVVDASRPELARFDGQVGLIKTVNMNGRALVEFQDYIANIGWYDIDLDFLKVVAKPEASVVAKVEKPAAKKTPPVEKVEKAAAKPASVAPAAAQTKKPASPGEKKLSPLELARMQGAVKRETGAAAAKPASGGPAAASPKPAAAVEGKKSSTAEILAAARTKKAAPVVAEASREAALASSTAPPSAPPGPIADEPTAVTEHAPIGIEPAGEPPKPKPARPAAVRQKLTTTAEKTAWCRTNDAGRNTTQ